MPPRDNDEAKKIDQIEDCHLGVSSVAAQTGLSCNLQEIQLEANRCSTRALLTETVRLLALENL